MLRLDNYGYTQPRVRERDRRRRWRGSQDVLPVRNLHGRVPIRKEDLLQGKEAHEDGPAWNEGGDRQQRGAVGVQHMLHLRREVPQAGPHRGHHHRPEEHRRRRGTHV